jgi:hypothetical protein
MENYSTFIYNEKISNEKRIPNFKTINLLDKFGKSKNAVVRH